VSQKQDCSSRNDNLFVRWLHNQTSLTMQHRPCTCTVQQMLILPMKVA